MLHGGIELHSFWTNDTEAIENNEKFEIPIPEESVTTKPITFYIIDNVQIADEKSCVVQSGGQDFMIAESAESVNRKIKERQNFLYN